MLWQRCTRSYTIRRGVGLALVGLLVFSLLPLMPAQRAEAIDLSVVYDPTVSGAVDPCSDPSYPACPDGVPRTDEMLFLVQVAAAYWATIFQDSHLFDIRVAWKVGGLPSAKTTNIDADGRPTAAIVSVPADMAFWYDPTPFDDDEYDMTPRLYRDTHPAEQIEAFNGAPPEILEVGYNGTGPSIDLLTILLHELGHAIGLNASVAAAQPVPTCDEQSDPYYHIDPALVGGSNMSIKAFEQFGQFPISGNHAHADHADHEGDDHLSDQPQARNIYDQPSKGFDCSHLALGGIKECGDDAVCKSHQALMWTGMLPNARARPSIADILAIATAAGWQEVHLPRKYSLASGLWQDGATWLGARVPNAGNNAYIINRENHVALTIYDLGQARDVLITDGNSVTVTFGTLDAYRITMQGAGTLVQADSGAMIDVVYLTNEAGGMLDLFYDATLDVFWTLRNDGLLRGGTGSVVEAHTFDNRGIVRANGGVFTIRASHDGPALDLDGIAEWPFNRVLDATSGDLVFDGVIADPVGAAVRVGGGQSVTFTQGWDQAFTGDAATALHLNGTSGTATVHGASRLAGYVVVDGRGRFTSSVQFLPAVRLFIDIDGSAPVTGYDQVVVNGPVTFAGTLHLSVDDPGEGGGGNDGVLDLVTPPFVPVPNQEFVIMTYTSHNGTFTTITGWDLGGIRLYPDYRPTELRMVARLVGDANGDGQLTNRDISALASSFGRCPANPVPCVADIDADGDIDKDDLHLLKEMLRK